MIMDQVALMVIPGIGLRRQQQRQIIRSTVLEIQLQVQR